MNNLSIASNIGNVVYSDEVLDRIERAFVQAEREIQSAGAAEKRASAYSARRRAFEETERAHKRTPAYSEKKRAFEEAERAFAANNIFVSDEVLAEMARAEAAAIAEASSRKRKATVKDRIVKRRRYGNDD